MSKDEDIEEFKEVMNTLKETVSQLIKSIVDTVYSSQNAEEFGKQVANFYKEMVNAGMNKEKAYELTKKFMESRDIAGVLNKILAQGNWKELAKINPEKMEEEVKKEIGREEGEE